MLEIIQDGTNAAGEPTYMVRVVAGGHVFLSRASMASALDTVATKCRVYGYAPAAMACCGSMPDSVWRCKACRPAGWVCLPG